MENVIIAFIVAQLLSTAYGLAVIGSVKPIIEKKLKDQGYVLKNTSGHNFVSVSSSFTGSPGKTGGASGDTASATPTFTGNEGTTGSNGSGSAFSILPPYVVKYCWERTA